LTGCADQRSSESQKRCALKAAWDLWLDCLTERAIAAEIGVAQETIGNWVTSFRNDPDLHSAPTSRKHIDIWQFAQAHGGSSYFGRMPPQVYTEPGDVVGRGTDRQARKDVSAASSPLSAMAMASRSPTELAGASFGGRVWARRQAPRRHCGYQPRVARQLVGFALDDDAALEIGDVVEPEEDLLGVRHLR
jgi:hypothetical protein